jgi:hypothetical protein
MWPRGIHHSDAAGDWSPSVVKGGTNGFVVTGTTTAGQIVAYTSTGTGGTWLPTGSLGDAKAESVKSATLGAGGTVIAVGATSGDTLGKQAVFLTASRAGAVRPVSLAAIPGGIVPELAVNALAALWWSPNLTSWTRGTSMNDTNGAGQVLAIGAVAHEFIAVGSDGGHPAVWTTTDGQDWTTINLGLPPGASAAALTQVAIDDEHVVALGQTTKAGQSVPFAELSGNGGASWQEKPFGSAGPGVAVTTLTASSGGFTAASQSGPPGQRSAQIWTSVTGSTWTPTQVSGLSGGGAHQISALVFSGSAVSGVGTTATEQSQQALTLSLPVAGGTG